MNPIESHPIEPHTKVQTDLCRIARFGANLTDSHSCFIFLPTTCFATLSSNALNSEVTQTGMLVLAGYHSLSTDVVENCRLPFETGLIGWVAKHHRSIHVSPFELDSRTLGIYTTDQHLKSFIGTPVSLSSSKEKNSGASGVVACDSKKSFAFSKIQGKLLEDLAQEISNTIQLLMYYSGESQNDFAWTNFFRRSEELVVLLGIQSIEVFRLKLQNFEDLELFLGTESCLKLLDQTYRLFQQALPPHFPVIRLLNGDILITLDNMMSSFYENKLRAICEHIRTQGKAPEFQFLRGSIKGKKQRLLSLEGLIAFTVEPNTQRELSSPLETTSNKIIRYGYR